MITLWNSSSSVSPWRTLLDFQRNLDRMMNFTFADTQGDSWSDQLVFHPPCDVEETESHYLVSADLPGISKKDINIEMRDNQIFITAERKSERKSTKASERYYGKFHRVVNLPAGVDADKIEAQYVDGVLTVALPKSEAAKGRQIKITDGKSSIFGKLLGKSESEGKEERTVKSVN
jgi:HSP20 family protein